MSGKTRIRETRPKPPLSRSPVPARRSTEEPAAATLDTAEAIRQMATSPLSGRRPENILALQQTLGNSAVQRLLARKRGPAGAAISPSPGPRQIQRNGDPPPEGGEGLSPEQMKKEKASIEKQVKGLPSLDDRVPSESAVKSAQKEGEAQGKEVQKLVEKGGPEMAAFLHAEMNPLGASGGGAAPAPEQSEAPPVSAPGPAPASAQQPEKGRATGFPVPAECSAAKQISCVL